jgi:hypothetical protein
MNLPYQINKWSDLYKHPLTDDEYSDICRNLSGFITILKEWNNKEGAMCNDVQTQCVRGANSTRCK